MTSRLGYTPPTDHRRNTLERYPAKPNPTANPMILDDGWPDDVSAVVFGSDDVDPNNDNAPLHIGGYPDLSRAAADQFIAARGLESFTKGRDEPAWGAGFTLVRDRAGEPHLLVGPETSPTLVRLDTIPDRVRAGMGDLGGLWLKDVPLRTLPTPSEGGRLTRDEVREIAREEATAVLREAIATLNPIR